MSYPVLVAATDGMSLILNLVLFPCFVAFNVISGTIPSQLGSLNRLNFLGLSKLALLEALVYVVTVVSSV